MFLTFLVSFALAAPPAGHTRHTDTPVKPTDKLVVDNHSDELLIVTVRTPDPLGGPDLSYELTRVVPRGQEIVDVDTYGIASCDVDCDLTVESGP